MTNAFDIIRSEYLFNKITSHLNHTDLPHCSVVNRYWNSLWSGTLSPSARIYTLRIPFTRAIAPSSTGWASLFTNCTRTTVDRSSSSKALNLAVATSRNSNSLACFAIESTTQAVQLNRDNLQLERLTIQGDFILTQNSEAPQKLFAALLQHPTLAHLQLGNIDTKIDYFLQRLSIEIKAMDQTHEHHLVIILSRCLELKDMSITHMDELNTSSSPLPSRPAHNLTVLIRNHCPKVYQFPSSLEQPSPRSGVTTINNNKDSKYVRHHNDSNSNNTDADNEDTLRGPDAMMRSFVNGKQAVRQQKQQSSSSSTQWYRSTHRRQGGNERY
ncbi:hypothetical protein F5H01DRAFT_365331 [Linnemannia elongata]|nr:hypothetical protein F5H01DRAFT_365331 [Linnemannia elongata]